MKPFLLLAGNVAAFNLAVYVGGLTGALIIAATIAADVMFIVTDLDAVRQEQYEDEARQQLSQVGVGRDSAGRYGRPAPRRTTDADTPRPYDWDEAA